MCNLVWGGVSLMSGMNVFMKLDGIGMVGAWRCMLVLRIRAFPVARTAHRGACSWIKFHSKSTAPSSVFFIAATL